MTQLTWKGASAAIVFGTALMFAAANAFADPPGIREEDVGKKLFSFNVIAVPEQSGFEARANACRGARIFFEDGNGNVMGTIDWTLDPGATPNFKITDCDGTEDGDANVVVNELLDLLVFIRVVGPRNNFLDLVCTEVVDFIGVDDLCLIDQTTIHKGNSFTKVLQNVAEGEFENVLFELDGDWKIFQVWGYEDLSAVNG